MDINKKIAIVIPAFKIEFLDECLHSIACQTNKNFTLYIGNDNSPYNIDAVVEKYRPQINMVYYKFPNNLGSVSLVQHWERCIEMIKEEEWIWLFSDDDIMEEDVINEFYKLETQTRDVYRFNLNIIDIHGNLLREVNFVAEESVTSFLRNRLSHQYDNVITNYIFSKEVYNRNNGFVDFPLAWGSDDASIILFAEEGSIKLIPNARISWRSSGNNITTNFEVEVLKQKIKARCLFVDWLYKEKLNLINSIEDHRKIVAMWFFHAMQIEYAWASKWERFIVINKMRKFVGTGILKLFFWDMQNTVKNNAISIFKKYKV